MSVEDNNITAAARRVLASMWIDLSRLHVGTTRGIINISGEIHRMTFEHGELTETVMSQLDDTLRQLDEVRYVRYDLENWEQTSVGTWKRILKRGEHKRPPEGFERTLFDG